MTNSHAYCILVPRLFFGADLYKKNRDKMADEVGEMDVDQPAQPSTSAPTTKKRFEVKKVSYYSKSWDEFR